MSDGQYQDKRVVDHLGRPWQEQQGYDSRFPLPHVLSFASIQQTAWQTYLSRQHDEALRDDPEGARFMRNDCFNEALLQERILAVASLEAGVEVEDEKDPAQKALKDGLNRVVNATRRRQTMIEYLSEAVWYGRYASQVAYEWREMRLPDPDRAGAILPRKAPVIVDHLPVNGDKINFRWDGTPTIQVNSSKIAEVPKASTVYTDRSRAIELRGSWRSRFILHKHRPRDADFMDSQGAGGIHGVGIRSVVYWYDWLRKEWLASISDWCERTGLGVRVWYYQGGNPQSEEAVKQAARKQSDKTNLLVPRYNLAGGRPMEGIEYVDTTSTGADLLLRLIEYLDQAKERYIVGQSMSGGSDNGDGLGGTGRARFAANTKGKITQSDANALADTLTADWIRPLAMWTYGAKYADLVRWKFVLDPPEPEKTLQAVGIAAELGVTFKEDDVRGLTGLAAPQDGDSIIGGKATMPAGPGMPQGLGFQVGHHTTGLPAMPGQPQEPQQTPPQKPEEQRPPAPEPVQHAREEQAERREARAFSTTQLNIADGTYNRTNGMPEPVVLRMAAKIPDEDLAAKGRETEPHITVKFGLHTANPDDVRRIVESFGPIAVTFGKTSVFAGDEYDVVKIDIESDDLRRLNALLSDSLDCTDTHPTYQPHATLAYVKPGMGKKYAGLTDMEGRTTGFSRLLFSDQQRERTPINLAPSNRTDEPLRHAFDPEQTRAKDGKWASAGHAALSSLGDKMAKAEHVGKALVERQVSRLPSHLQSLVRGVWHAAMGAHEAAQAAVEAVAKAKGLHEDQRATLARWTAAVNLIVGGKLLPAAAAAAGAGPLGAAISGFTPVGSAAYLAFSTATDPQAVFAAAKEAVQKRLAGRGGKVDHDKSDLLEQLAERSTSSGFDGWMAHFLAALDETEGDVDLSVSLADECQEPERYASGDDSPMELIRRLPEAQARSAAIGILAMLAVRPDLRRDYSTADLAFLEALAGPHRYSAHDVSDEARGSDGKWSANGDADPGDERPGDHEHLKTLKGLYRSALSSGFSHDAAAAKVTEIAKGMKAPELRAIADKWDLVLPANASKGAIAEAMTRRIFERRAFHMRTQINASETL